MTINITTISGKNLAIAAGYPELKVTVEVKGEIHTVGAKLANNSNLGDYLDLDQIIIGKKALDIKAPISAETVKQIKSQVIAPAEAKTKAKVDADKATRAEWLKTPEGRSWLLSRKMDRADSDM